MIALLTSETLQMVNIIPSPHHHLKSRYHFRTSRAITSVTEQSEIVPFAQNQIRFGIQRGTDFA